MGFLQSLKQMMRGSSCGCKTRKRSRISKGKSISKRQQRGGYQSPNSKSSKKVPNLGSKSMKRNSSAKKINAV